MNSWTFEFRFHGAFVSCFFWLMNWLQWLQLQILKLSDDSTYLHIRMRFLNSLVRKHTHTHTQTGTQKQQRFYVIALNMKRRCEMVIGWNHVKTILLHFWLILIALGNKSFGALVNVFHDAHHIWCKWNSWYTQWR